MNEIETLEARIAELRQIEKAKERHRAEAFVPTYAYRIEPFKEYGQYLHPAYVVYRVHGTVTNADEKPPTVVLRLFGGRFSERSPEPGRFSERSGDRGYAANRFSENSAEYPPRQERQRPQTLADMPVCTYPRSLTLRDSERL